jgi:hypothetical protein
MNYADRPALMPSRPDLVYRGQFLGWAHFLGSKKMSPVHIVEEAKGRGSLPNASCDTSDQGEHQPINQTTSVLYHLYLSLSSPNHIYFMPALNSDIPAFSQRIRAYNIDDVSILSKILKSHSRPGAHEYEYIVSNMNELLFDLDTSF